MYFFYIFLFSGHISDEIGDENFLVFLVSIYKIAS